MTDDTRTLHGLPRPEGGWRALSDYSDDDLADGIVASALRLREGGAEAYASLAMAAGLPLAEVVASPFSLRAVAMAVMVGATTAHLELRGHSRVEEHADDLVADGRHASWEDGVLIVGKYQGFRQDDPVSTFNPNHMAKWGPHELLHRVCRFFWRADMSRWELYLGGRLNELVPVVHWYGPDELLRLDREGFDRSRDASAREISTEQAHWLTAEEGELRARALRDVCRLRAGLTHFRLELEAIDEEIRTGRSVHVQHSFPGGETLNSASDAVAYVVGHYERLTSESAQVLFGHVLSADRDYATSIATYAAQVEACFESLLFDEIDLSLATALHHQSGRRLWDWVARQAWEGNLPDDGNRDELLTEVGVAIGDAVEGRSPARLSHWRDRLALPSAVQNTGLGRWNDVEQLEDGLWSCLPATSALLARADVSARGSLRALATAFAQSRAVSRRAPLTDRFIDFLGNREDVGEITCELARFERALLGAREIDPHVEHLAIDEEMLPMPLAGGLLLGSAAFDEVRLCHDVGPLHASLCEEESRPTAMLDAMRPTEITYLIGRYRDQVAVLPAPESVLRLWRAACEQPLTVPTALGFLEEEALVPSQLVLPESAEEWVYELLYAGVLGFIPELSGRG